MLTLVRQQRRALRLLALVIFVSWAVFQGGVALFLSITQLDEVFLPDQHLLLVVVSLIAVMAGILVGRYPRSVSSRRYSLVLDGARGFATQVVIVSFPILFVWGLLSAYRLHSMGYGDIEATDTVQNILSYIVLSLLPVLLWNRDKFKPRTYWTLIACVVIPRALVSLFGPRFFVLQALIPLGIWEVSCAKQLRMGRIVLFSAVIGYILFFLAPSLRKEETSGVQNIYEASPVLLWSQMKGLGLGDEVGNNLVPCELAANITTSDVCGLRRLWGIPRSVPVRLDQAATFYIREITGIPSIGTGGNPLIEAFPTGKLQPLGVCWFLLAGIIAGWTVAHMSTRPICCFLLPHVSAKILFLWRGTISEFFDRIPLILASYVLVAGLVWAIQNCKNARLLQSDAPPLSM